MIQAARLTDTENQARFDDDARSARHDQTTEPGPGILGVVFCVVVVAALASVVFHSAHAMATQCTPGNLLDLMRACGAQVVVR